MCLVLDGVPGKITEAAVAGVALAALYYRFGLPSTILLHWAIDYALTALSLAPWLAIGYGLFILYTRSRSVVVIGSIDDIAC